MPERDRQLARVLNLCLSVAAAVTFAVAAPVANAQTDSRQPPNSGSTSSSANSSKGNSKSSTTPPKPPPPAVCPAQVAPPQVPDDGDGDPMQPVDVPEAPVGGDRLGDCGAVLPTNATLPQGNLSAASWVVADQDSGDILAAYAPHARQRPAGAIKVLLAMVALRELDPNATIVATKEDTQTKLSRVGLVPDGKYSTHDLIRAVIVTSASDAASAISRALGGADEAVKKMNALAAELKADDTRAVNPFGSDQPGMSTSAYDMATIYREAMRIPEFADATGASKVTITPQGNRKTVNSRSNDSAKLLDDYKGMTGGKYGQTEAAKNTFVGSAERNGRHVVISILRSDKQPWDQAESLLDYGFDLINAKVQPVGKLSGSTDPNKATRDTSVVNSADQDDEAAQPGVGTLQRSAFGNFGLPVTILAGVVVLLMMLMTVRRKMARARRMRTQQAR